MTKKRLQKEWKKIISEVHDKPKCQTPYPSEVVRVRELLLFAEVILGKIETRDKVTFHEELYEKIMPEYYRQKLCLKI